MAVPAVRQEVAAHIQSKTAKAQTPAMEETAVLVVPVVPAAKSWYLPRMLHLGSLSVHLLAPAAVLEVPAVQRPLQDIPHPVVPRPPAVTKIPSMAAPMLSVDLMVSQAERAAAGTARTISTESASYRETMLADITQAQALAPADQTVKKNCQEPSALHLAVALVAVRPMEPTVMTVL